MLCASKVFVVTSDLLEVSCNISITTPQAFLCNTEEMNLKWNVAKHVFSNSVAIYHSVFSVSF